MNKTNQKGTIAWELLFILIIICVSILMISTSLKGDIARLENHDKCLTEVIQAIPDPNETEQRSALLKTCMEQ